LASSSYWNSVLTRRISRRRALAVAGGTALGTSLLVACGGGDDDGGSDGGASALESGSVFSANEGWKLKDETKGAVRGGIYRGWRQEDQVGHYDAINLVDSLRPHSDHIHEMLLQKNLGPGIDPASPAAQNPVGALAESWEFSADATEVTFKLRKGVKWHDIAPVSGRELDIDDFKTSHERHLEIGNYRKTIGRLLDKTTYPDADHMTWHLKAPYAPLSARIWHGKFGYPIQPKELNADVALAERTAIGTGYKILDKHEAAVTMEYRKNPEYWGGEVFIDRWHVPIIPEYANTYSQFLAGNIIDFFPTARDVIQLHKDAPGAVVVANSFDPTNATRHRFGQISPSEQAWADKRVRQAIRMSIDFASIGKFLSNRVELETAGIPVTQITMTHLPHDPGYWLDPVKGELGGGLDANYLYDPAEAKKRIEAAGFTTPIPLPYFVALTNGEVAEEDQLVMDSLQASGNFDLQITRAQSRTEHNKYRLDGEFDGLIPQSGSTDDADYFAYRDYHSEGNPRGVQAYPLPEVDELSRRQREALNVDDRITALQEFQRFMADWMMTVPGRDLFTTFSFRHPWVHNTAFGTTPENDPPSGVSLGGWHSPPEGRHVLGGHLQWLDKDMPNRETGA